jgi:DNA glycosylase AlkZ-like
MTTLSWPEVCARRLLRHALAEPEADCSPADIAGAMCGAHAQVLSAAELSIGLRLAGGTRSDVRAALWTQRSLVKTYGPRGTVHLLPTRDLPMWTGALSAIPSSPSPFPEEVRLTGEQTEQVLDAIAHALADAELTVDELGAAVVAATGSWAGDLVMPAFQTMWPRWRQAITAAAHRGVLCFGPNRGRRVTYTSPRRWLPGFVPAEGGAALRELVTRYLRAYGPATPHQFAQWLGTPTRWAVRLFERLGDQLQPVDFEDTPVWLAAGDTGVQATEPAGVRLLPYFDAYVIGSQPRARLYPGPAAKRALTPSGQAGNFPVLLVDGVVGGVWHQRRTGQRIDITVEPLTRLTAKQRRDLNDQTVNIGRILEGKPRLTIGTVNVGGHA